MRFVTFSLAIAFLACRNPEAVGQDVKPLHIFKCSNAVNSVAFSSVAKLLAGGTGDGKSGEVEWYPAGRLVLWTAILGALGVAIMVPYLGLDKQTFEATLRTSFQRMLRAQTAADGTLQIPGVKDPKALLDLLVAFMPMAAALLGTVVHMFNLWLAGRVVRMSGATRPGTGRSARLSPSDIKPTAPARCSAAAP